MQRLHVSAICECPVQDYAKVSWLSAVGQMFSLNTDVDLTLCLPVVEVEGYQHCFCLAELQLPFLEVCRNS